MFGILRSHIVEGINRSLFVTSNHNKCNNNNQYMVQVQHLSVLLTDDVLGMCRAQGMGL